VLTSSELALVGGTVALVADIATLSLDLLTLNSGTPTELVAALTGAACDTLKSTITKLKSTIATATGSIPVVGSLLGSTINAVVNTLLGALVSPLQVS
jgi:hypothetical protein